MSDNNADDNKFANPSILRGAMALAHTASELRKSAATRDKHQAGVQAQRELSTPAPSKPKP